MRVLRTMTIRPDPRFVWGPRPFVPSVKMHCTATWLAFTQSWVKCDVQRCPLTHRITDALKEEEHIQTCDTPVTLSERDTEAACHACEAVHAQQECRIDEAQHRRAKEAPACECELAECEHEARARMAYALSLVNKVVHREGRDANLGTSTCVPTRGGLSALAGGRIGEGRIGVHVHVAGLRDKAEDAVMLLVEGSHVRGSSAVRGGELAGERLLRDLWQIAIAILATGSSLAAASIVTGRLLENRKSWTHKKSTLSTTPRPNTARYTH